MIFYWELSDPHLAWQGRTTLSPNPLPNPRILNVFNLLCCSSRSVIKLFNSSSLPSDLLLWAFRSSLLPRSTLSLASLARQSFSLTPPHSQSPNPQCSQLTLLFFKISYKTIQFLFPAQWSFTESFQILTPTTFQTFLGQLWKTELLSHLTPYPISQSSMFSTMLLLKVSYKTIQFLFPAQWSFTESFQVFTPTPLYIVSGQLGKTATLSPHHLPNLPILHLLNLLCCSSRSVTKLFNSSSLPSDLLLRAFRSSFLPLSTLSWASLARQSYSLTSPPTQSPNPQCSQLCCSSRSVIKLFNSSSLPNDLLLRAFRSSLLPLSTLSLASLARQLLPHPTPYPILNVLNYHIIGYFRVAKFSRSCLKKHGDYFSRKCREK